MADYSCNNCPPGFIGKNCDREEEGEGEGEGVCGGGGGGGGGVMLQPLICLLDAGSSSEGVDAVTIAGGAVGIVLLILIILILVVVLVFLLRKHRRMKVQITGDAHPTTAGTINLKLNPVYGVSTTQAQTNFPATSEVIALMPNPVYGVSSAPQDTTEYYVNEGMGPVEPPQYDHPVVEPPLYNYPVVEPRQPMRAKDIPMGQNPAYSSTSN